MGGGDSAFTARLQILERAASVHGDAVCGRRRGRTASHAFAGTRLLSVCSGMTRGRPSLSIRNSPAGATRNSCCSIRGSQQAVAEETVVLPANRERLRPLAHTAICGHLKCKNRAPWPSDPAAAGPGERAARPLRRCGNRGVLAALPRPDRSPPGPEPGRTLSRARGLPRRRPGPQRPVPGPGGLPDRPRRLRSVRPTRATKLESRDVDACHERGRERGGAMLAERAPGEA